MSFFRKPEPLTVWVETNTVKDLDVLNIYQTLDLQTILAREALEESVRLTSEAEQLEAQFLADHIVDDKHSDSLFVLTDCLILLYGQDLLVRNVWTRADAHKNLYEYKQDLDSWRHQHLSKALLHPFVGNEVAVEIQNKIVKVVS